MTWHTGTASNFKDLLDKLQGHLTSDGWTVNSYTTGNAAPNTDVLYVKAPGYGTGYENYTCIRTYEDSSQSHYCLELVGATGYDADQDFFTQPGSAGSGRSVFMRLWNSTMTYWLSVSDRRFLLIAKASNTYHSMYAGFLNAFALPTEYPYPYFYGSDSGTADQFGATGSYDRCVAFPGVNGAYVREPGGLWRIVCMYTNGYTYGYQGAGDSTRYAPWPYCPVAGNPSFTSTFYGAAMKMEQLPGKTDSLPFVPVHLVNTANLGGCLGTLEGVYWIPGVGNSAEQEFTYNSDTYISFIAISRSLESVNQFYAVKEA